MPWLSEEERVEYKMGSIVAGKRHQQAGYTPQLSAIIELDEPTSVQVVHPGGPFSGPMSSRLLSYHREPWPEDECPFQDRNTARYLDLELGSCPKKHGIISRLKSLHGIRIEQSWFNRAEGEASNRKEFDLALFEGSPSRVLQLVESLGGLPPITDVRCPFEFCPRHCNFSPY